MRGLVCRNCKRNSRSAESFYEFFCWKQSEKLFSNSFWHLIWGFCEAIYQRQQTLALPPGKFVQKNLRRISYFVHNFHFYWWKVIFITCLCSLASCTGKFWEGNRERIELRTIQNIIMNDFLKVLPLTLRSECKGMFKSYVSDAQEETFHV